ncbi:MAG: uridine kinase [Bacilli bacterium]|jgi:uridine kinase
MIGIAGGTASGKSTLVELLVQSAPKDSICVIRLDDYYYHRPDLTLEERDQVNYDSPATFEVPLLLEHLRKLKKGQGVLRPRYDFTIHLREEELVEAQAAPVIIVEGILVLAIPEIRELLDYKIYFDTPSDIRLLRRIHRDIRERGRTFESVAEQYLKTVRPMHELYIEPSKVHADVIIPDGMPKEEILEIIWAKIGDRIQKV